MRSSRSSPSSAPSSRRCRPGVKVVVLPLTPSCAPLAAGPWGFDAPLPRGQEPRGPPPSAAPSSATFFTGPERLAISRALGAARLRDASPRAKGDLCNPAIHEHSLRSPETHLAPSTRHLAVALSSWALALSDDRRVRSGWRGAPCGVTPVELHQNRTRSARAAQVPSSFAWPCGGGPRSGAPDPPQKGHAGHALSRSDWLGHLLSRARGSIGWRGRSIRALARRPRARLGLCSPSQTCSREVRCLSTCSRRPPGQRARLSRSSAKRTAIRGAQGVFHLLRSSPEEVVDLAWRARQSTRPPGGWTSIHSLFPTCG